MLAPLIDDAFICACVLLVGFFGCLMVEFGFCVCAVVVVADEILLIRDGGGLRLCLRRSTSVEDAGLVTDKSVCMCDLRNISLGV